MKHHAWPMLAVAATLLAPCTASAAFRCPAAGATARGDTPRLNADDMAGAVGTVSSTLESTIRRMQADGVKSGEIVDRLVMADCSLIDAEPNVSDTGKAGQVRHFASKIADFIYTASGQTEEDTVLDVPVPNPLYTRIQHAAKAAGLSEDAWVKKAISRQLGE